MIYLKLLGELIVMLVFTYYILEALYIIYQEHENAVNGKPRRNFIPYPPLIKEEAKNKEYTWWLEFTCYSLLGLGCIYGVMVVIRNLISGIFL